MKSFKYILLFLLVFLFNPHMAFAGGGPIALTSFPLKPFDQTKTFILHAEVFTEEPCSSLKPSFSFTDSKAGDSITPYTPPTDGTFITRHWYPTSKWVEICDFYMQAKSGTPEQRTALVTIMVNGETKTDDTQIAYGDDYYSKQLQSFGRVNDAENSPHIDVINERFLGGVKREVEVHWQKIPWADKYAIFSTMASDEAGTSYGEFSPFPPTTETKAYINIQAFYPFYLAVKACKADDPCTTLGESYYSVHVDKMRNVTSAQITSTQSPKISQKPVDTTPVVPTIKSDEKIEELNKKIAELEGKVEASEKKQEGLQKTLNMLLDWIRARFPFFQG